MKTATITIDGAEETIDLEDILTIKDPSSERMEVAVHLAYWGAIWGAKLEEQELADASYRTWHGETIVELLGNEEKASGKSPAEWKVKAVVESNAGFADAKSRIAKAARDVATAKAIFDAYSRKADVLARLIAREDTERVRSGEIGRASEDNEASKADKIAKAQAAIAKTRAARTST